MKYIKLFEDLQTKAQIEDWLNSQVIVDFVVNDDLTVNCNDAVRLAGREMTIIPVQFEYADSFYVQNNKLTSLKGCPETVYNYFSCSRNQINSLEFGPKFEAESYVYYENPCSGDFNQIQYIPITAMLNGKAYNYRITKGRGYFEFKQKDMDEYWEEKIKTIEPKIYSKKLVENENELTYQSNNVSPKLMHHITRGKSLDLWDFKTKII